MVAEVTVWSVNARTPQGDPGTVDPAPDAPAPDSIAGRQMFDAALGRAAAAGVYARAAMTPGARIAGPAAITEDETTIIVPNSRTARALSDGCIALDVKVAS